MQINCSQLLNRYTESFAMYVGTLYTYEENKNRTLSAEIVQHMQKMSLKLVSMITSLYHRVFIFKDLSFDECMNRRPNLFLYQLYHKFHQNLIKFSRIFKYRSRLDLVFDALAQLNRYLKFYVINLLSYLPLTFKRAAST